VILSKAFLAQRRIWASRAKPRVPCDAIIACLARSLIKLHHSRRGENSKRPEATIMARRNIFGELMEGVAAMKAHREGKLTCAATKLIQHRSPRLIRSLSGTRARSCAVRERFLRANCGLTKELWRNGNRAALNPIRKPPHWCCSFANTPTCSNGWKESPQGRPSELTGYGSFSSLERSKIRK